MNIDTALIAREFGLTEEALAIESTRVFLKEHLRLLEADRKTRCAKFGVKTLEEMDGLRRRGEVAEEAIFEDFQEVDHLCRRIDRVTTLLEELPPAPRETLLTMDEIREILKAEMTFLKENYSVKSLGIFGPYATGTARPYDRVGVLVDFYKTPGLAFFGLERKLGETLGVGVHVATIRGLRPEEAEHVMSELVTI